MELLVVCDLSMAQRRLQDLGRIAAPMHATMKPSAGARQESHRTNGKAWVPTIVSGK